MPINITLDIGGGDANKASSLSPYAELFLKVIESPKGLALECGSEKAAVAKRFQLYQKRNALRKAGNSSFDDIIITVDGNELRLVVPPPITLREL